MKAQIFAALLVSTAFLGLASAETKAEPAGAPAIRLVRAALPAYAKAPSVFAEQLRQSSDVEPTAGELASEAEMQTLELGQMLDEVKTARSNPESGVNTSIVSSFKDGKFGIEINTSNVRSIETTNKTVVCKALSKSGSKTAYNCTIAFWWGGEFESVQSYELTFIRDSKTGAIVPRKITRIMAG